MEKAHLMWKKKNILILVKMVRKALYKIIAIGEKDQAQLQIQWGQVTKEESEGGSVGGKSLREAIKGRESFAKPT